MMRARSCLFAVIAALAGGEELRAQERPVMILPPSQGVIRPSQPPAPRQVPRAAPRQQPGATASTTVRPPAAPDPSAPKPPVPAALEKPLLELSEAMGSLAFLADLCSPLQQPNAWQGRMERLVSSDGEALGNKEKLMGSYNQGYVAFSTTYRQCTDAAQAAQTLLIKDAARIARDLERRFGS